MAVDPFDIEELLGAYALDAVTDEEREAVEEYLRANPRARAEVQEHCEVATMLAWSGMDAPDGLWERIAGSIEGDARLPESELGRVLSINPRSTRRRWTRTVASWGVATAAAALIAVVAVKVSSDDDTQPQADPVAVCMRDPASSQAELKSPADGALKVRAVICPDGRGILLADSLPHLDSSRTYQLWGQTAGGTDLISLAVLGAEPATVQFSVDGDLALLAITEEVAGGVVTSKNPVVVAGSPV